MSVTRVCVRRRGRFALAHLEMELPSTVLPWRDEMKGGSIRRCDNRNGPLSSISEKGNKHRGWKVARVRASS